MDKENQETVIASAVIRGTLFTAVIRNARLTVLNEKGEPVSDKKLIQAVCREIYRRLF